MFLKKKISVLSQEWFELKNDIFFKVYGTEFACVASLGHVGKFFYEHIRILKGYIKVQIEENGVLIMFFFFTNTFRVF